MDQKELIIRLYGAFSCQSSDGTQYEVVGDKHRALLAMLATAANFTHTRRWLQDTLWGRSEIKNRRESLRRALSDLRKIFANDFNSFFSVTNIDVRLRKKIVRILGNPTDGVFLEGINIPGQGGFEEWLTGKRERPLGHLALNDFCNREDICPTIAIVPFLSRTDMPEEAHFNDLVTLEITRSLSRSKLINVISHLSSRRFSSRSLDLPRVRTALQIDYLVHGTLYSNEGTYRLDADFIHASSGKLHWSRTYTGSQVDLLAGNGQVVRKISAHIGQEILRASVELSRSKPLPHVESHALFMSAIAEIHQHRLVNFSNARKLLEHLISRSPDHSVLHAWLAKWYILSISQGWSDAPKSDLAKANDSIKRALDIDASCPFSLTVDGMLLSNHRRDLPNARRRFKQAVTMDPNNALAWLMYARMHAYRGDGKQAVLCSDKARALSPLDPYGYFFDSLSGMCQIVAGNLHQGYALISKSLTANPNHSSTHRAKTIVLQMMSREMEARNAAKTLMRLEPGLTVEGYTENHPTGHSKIGRLWAEALKEAGVPSK